MSGQEGIFRVGYDGIEAVTNHVRFGQEQEADLRTATAVHEKVGADLSQNILKVCDRGLYVAGYGAATQIHTMQYAQGNGIRLSAMSDVGHIRFSFGHAAAPRVFTPANTPRLALAA